ncbi:Glutathione S-transferase 1, isoform C [Pseudolycoriella hygida]|uniref:glutathione transferase n=1 Tax=Pseudolycoriella hygida TaxID=35572 RepID=A0A9Q0MPI4_9DIPT|nr:Glutathione S-transferase 1, isoform C [Pseudolycoriella hygida]
MGLDFYMLPGSAPCSIVQMTAKAVGVELNTKVVDLFAGEHLQPEYLKINPQHVVPTLVTEEGVSLWESRSIATYLIEKYGKDDSLYPKDPLKRAIVNQRLYFDLGTFYQRLMERYYPLLFPTFEGRVIPNAEDNLKNAVGFLNSFLDGNDFAAGEAYTVADISLLATTETLKACDFDLSPFSNVVAWYERAKAITPGFDINEMHGKEFRKFFK